MVEKFQALIIRSKVDSRFEVHVAVKAISRIKELDPSCSTFPVAY